MAAIPSLNIVEFRAFTSPDFDSTTTYPDAVISQSYDFAVDVMGESCSCLTDDQIKRALFCLMAHALLIGMVGGSTTGNALVNSTSTTDSVSVGDVSVSGGTSTASTPQSDIDRLELNQTAYGKRYIMLSSKCAKLKVLVGRMKLNMRVR